MEFTERTLNKIMVLKGGSPAMHMLGNIGRKDDEYIRVYAESEDEYIGVFEEGFGFIDVRFKKNDCRAISEDEYNFLNKQLCVIGNNVLHNVSVDKNGNVI